MCRLQKFVISERMSANGKADLQISRLRGGLVPKGKATHLFDVRFIRAI